MKTLTLEQQRDIMKQRRFIAMPLLVFVIALPVADIDHTALPLSIGILTGLMWMPLSWAIQHWVGYFHTIARTFGILIAWYVFPEARIEAISAVIVIVYLVSMVALEARYRAMNPQYSVILRLTQTYQSQHALLLALFHTNSIFIAKKNHDLLYFVPMLFM